jgi:hypothetical protein
MDRKKLPEGVISSDSDEMEGRFGTGKANLYVNAEAYGGYYHAAFVAKALGLNDYADECSQKAQALRKAIDKYFGANVQGFDTYQFYQGSTNLRTNMAYTLLNRITERKDGTANALLSDKLWSENGFYVESGKPDYWDRYTLPAFQGLLACGKVDMTMKKFEYYTSLRLLGERAPYPIEAWPEGDKRHLSPEGAMYCRVITEGMLGISPTGLNSFTMFPALPKGWNYLNLRRIHAFDRTFDIEVTRKVDGEIIVIKPTKGAVITKKWDGKEPVTIILS